jgi:hypothetical protein
VATAALAFVFHGGIAPNATSRALTVLGLTEMGTLSADPWTGATIDYATVNGHTYSDKAPLSSFVVLPFYFAWSIVRGRPYAHPFDLKVLVLTGDIVAAGIPLGVFALLVARRASRWVSPRRAVLLALVGVFGTPLLSYGGSYMGHVLAGLLLALAYHMVTRAGDEGVALERASLIAGLCAGLAVLAELPMAIGTTLIGAYLALRSSGWRLVLRYVAGGAPCAAALGAYQLAITGSPFDPPYHHLPHTFDQARPYVFDLHALGVAWQLLFGQYRGLFFYAPALLVAAPLAFARLSDGRRRALLACLAVAQLGFVASFWMWDGGWCVGPRHLAWIMMLFLYEGVQAVAETPRAQPLFVGLAGLGVAINAIAVATNPFAPSTRPFSELYWPAFVHGTMTKESVFRMLGLDLGKGCVAVWGALFVLAIVGLGRLADWAAPRPAASRV